MSSKSDYRMLPDEELVHRIAFSRADYDGNSWKELTAEYANRGFSPGGLRRYRSWSVNLNEASYSCDNCRKPLDLDRNDLITGEFECPECRSWRVIDYGKIQPFPRIPIEVWDISTGKRISDSKGLHSGSARHLSPGVPPELRDKAMKYVRNRYFPLALSILAAPAVGVALIVLLIVLSEAIGITPIGIILLLGLGILVGMVASIKGMLPFLFRHREFEPALLVDLNREPTLRSLIEETCSNIGTDTPDSVILHSEPQFFVKQGESDVWNGTVKGRILAISLPLMRQFTVSEFRAILAHEFAHFSGDDTEYSVAVRPVYDSLVTALQHMEDSAGSESDSSWIMAIPLQLPHWIMRSYLERFHMIHMRISRLQEERADFRATLLSGTEKFRSALEKTVVYGEHWASVAMPTIANSLAGVGQLSGYYERLGDIIADSKSQIDEIRSRAMATEDDPFSSHPSLKTRLANLPEVNMSGEDGDLATSLLAHISEYERRSSVLYLSTLAKVMGLSGPPDARSYCPRCRTTYVLEGGECANCEGVRLITLEE